MNMIIKTEITIISNKAKHTKFKQLMETEKNLFYHNSTTFSLINIKKNPLSDHIGWCSLTYTPITKSEISRRIGFF
jgi:hypothetical protein